MIIENFVGPFLLTGCWGVWISLLLPLPYKSCQHRRLLQHSVLVVLLPCLRRPPWLPSLSIYRLSRVDPSSAAEPIPLCSRGPRTTGVRRGYDVRLFRRAAVSLWHWRICQTVSLHFSPSNSASSSRSKLGFICLGQTKLRNLFLRINDLVLEPNCKLFLSCPEGFSVLLSTGTP